MSGISYCDANFSSGCYHEFIGQAIADKGVSVIPQLDAFCEKSTTGCPHGIGHGLITYFGYTGSDLAKAIPICLSLPDGKSLGGCMGGAFMEYNMRTMIDTNNTAVRPATSTKDLFSPCDEFSGRAEESCLLYQPQWWWTIFAQSSGLAGFAKMTGLCEKFAVGSANRNICFVGVGEMVSPGTGYDAEKSGQLCGSQTNDVSERFYCLAGSAIVFNGTGYAQKAQTVCQSIGDADRAASCMKYAQTSGALVNI